MSKRREGLAVAVLVAIGAVLAVAARRQQETAWGGGSGPAPPPAGVREPRRPLGPTGSGSQAVDPATG